MLVKCVVLHRSLMYSEANRRETFTSWPHAGYRWAQPDPMAQAGFYHQVGSERRRPHLSAHGENISLHQCVLTYTFSICIQSKGCLKQHSCVSALQDYSVMILYLENKNLERNSFPPPVFLMGRLRFYPQERLSVSRRMPAFC